MLGGATALSCLNGSGGVVRPTISSNSAADTVCAAYSLADTTDWEYTSLSNATCLQYQRSPDKYSNVWCCDEPNCNVPDPLKDNVTRVDNTTVLANATTANATNISTTTSPKVSGVRVFRPTGCPSMFELCTMHVLTLVLGLCNSAHSYCLLA